MEPHPNALYTRAADLHIARAAVERLEENHPNPSAFRHTLHKQPDTATRIGAIMGMSSALADIVIVHPELVGSVDERIDARLEVPEYAEEREQIDALRLAYYRRLIAIAATDLVHDSPEDYVSDVARALADLAGHTLDAATGMARRFVPESERIDFAIIAMGKTGAAELNYISDVDVIYVAQPRDAQTSEEESARIGAAMATWISHAVSAPGPVPALWELDANLRPEGKNGPLVRTVASHKAYYDRWAQPWEFQALLKARPIAGDPALADAYMAQMRPMVWDVANRDGFVESVRRMRERVEAHVPRARANRQLKLGAGGLRDIEFTVQLLQLVHGRTDESLRVRGTIEAIGALVHGGYIGREAGGRLEEHYRFLRLLEHRIQLQRLRRSHEVPPVGSLGRIAASMGMDAPELERRWQKVRADVRELHTAIFYHPLLPSLASLDADNVVLEETAAGERLAAIGFRDPARALRNLHALSSGLSRTAVIQRHVLPAMIGWMAEAVEPDHGLNAFRDVSERLGSTSWYMRLLRDSAVVAPRLAHVLSTSRYVAQMLPTLPDAILWFDDDDLLAPRHRADMVSELDALMKRRSDPRDQAMAGRYLRRREMLRMAIGQVLRAVSPEQVREALSDAMDLAVSAALRAAVGDNPLGLRHAVIALGRLGGREIGYVSDADLMFVYEVPDGVSDDDAYREAQRVTTDTLAFLKTAGAEPAIDADIKLRPEGKHGAITRSVSSYLAYYERWGETWERQALLRARFCAGDEDTAKRWTDGISTFRYPPAGLSPQQIRDIRILKTRMENERLPRGTDPSRHVKLGRGGLTDVEWTIQLSQLTYAGRNENLQQTNTISAIHNATECGLIDLDSARKLTSAWKHASLIRDLNLLATGKTGTTVDIVPDDPHTLRLIAAIAGKPETESHDIPETYLRDSRRARAVTNKLFYEEN